MNSINKNKINILNHKGIFSSSGLVIRPSHASFEIYSDLALQSMQRILKSFTDIKKFGTKVCVYDMFI